MSHLREYIPKSSVATDYWSFIGIPARGEKLYQSLKQGLSYRVFETLAKLSCLDKKDFAKIVTIPPATLRRRSLTGKFTQDESDRLYRYAEVMKAAKDLFEGDQQAANKWLEKSIRGLGGHRPIDMLATTAETEAVLDLIGRLEYGVFA